MKLSHATSALLLIVFSCACAPQRRDPYSGIKMVDAAFPNTRLGLIVSENTEKNLDYARKASRFPGCTFDPERSFEKGVEILQRNFKSVVRIERAANAQAADVDVTAIYDTHANVPWILYRKIKAEGKLIFLAKDGAQIDIAEATAERRPDLAKYVPGLLIPPLMANAMCTGAIDAAEDVLTQLERVLRNSAVLRELEIAHSKMGAATDSRASGGRRIFSAVDKPSYSRPEDENKFALVIGVEKYQSAPEAPFAERDARAVRDHLLALGYPQRNIAFLTGTNASRAGISKYLESWLPERVQKRSKVLVYFSGHGAPDLKTKQAYLVPVDGDAKFLSQTAYPMHLLIEKLAALRAKTTIVALDTCFSGLGERSILPKGTRPLVSRVEIGSLGAKNGALLSASANEEISGVSYEQGHGLFTYFLLNGLNESKGSASLDELIQYVEPKVRDAARLDNRDQTPQLSRSEPAIGRTQL